MKEKEKNMNYVDLNSVGSTVTDEGVVFPIDCSEAPETASDAEEMMGVHIYDTTDEWWSSLSLVDGTDVLEFIELNTDIISETIFNDWKEKKFTGYDLDMQYHFHIRHHNWSTTNMRTRIFEAERKKRE